MRKASVYFNRAKAVKAYLQLFFYTSFIAEGVKGEKLTKEKNNSGKDHNDIVEGEISMADTASSPGGVL